MNLKELQKKLNKCRKLSDRFDKNIDLLKLEIEYQIYCSKLIKSYLEGSSFYVGPSILEYLKNKPLNSNLLSLLFFISHKL
jgi:hypothetical protein